MVYLRMEGHHCAVALSLDIPREIDLPRLARCVGRRPNEQDRLIAGKGAYIIEVNGPSFNEGAFPTALPRLKFCLLPHVRVEDIVRHLDRQRGAGLRQERIRSRAHRRNNAISGPHLGSQAHWDPH